MSTSVLWRRLDTPGHDACRVEGDARGWRLDGATVFLHEGLAVRLDYELECDRSWVSKRGRMRGWIGSRSVVAEVVRTPEGTWTLNGRAAPEVANCLDLDFGFTAATNMPQLQRLMLAEGQAADVAVAWLDLDADSLALLPQRYERRTASTYGYSSPTTGYEALLEVAPHGFVREYPGLWAMEDDGS